MTKEQTTTTQNGESSITASYYTYDAGNRLIRRVVNDNGEAHTYSTGYDYQDVYTYGSAGSRVLTENAFVTTETEVLTGSNYTLSETVQDHSGNTLRTKENGLYTEYLYDSYGIQTGTYEAGADAFSEDGLLTLTVQDANGNTTDTVVKPEYRSGEGWAVSEDSIVTSSQYSAAGKETASIDAMSNVTSYSYDAKGELAEVVQPGGSKTSFATEEVYTDGILETVETTTDANGNVSKTRTNESGNTVKTKDLGAADGSDTAIWSSYEYDEKDRLVKKSQAEGNYITYTYNTDDQVICTGYYAMSGASAKKTMETKYTYDRFGNIIRLGVIKIMIKYILVKKFH